MVTVTRLASRVVLLVGLMALRPAWAETIVCTAENPHHELAFDLDYNGGTVSTEVPVNWVWFGRHFVMFLHSVAVLDRTYVTQMYTFDNGDIEQLGWPNRDNVASHINIDDIATLPIARGVA